MDFLSDLVPAHGIDFLLAVLHQCETQALLITQDGHDLIGQLIDIPKIDFETIMQHLGHARLLGNYHRRAIDKRL